jgi:hypothetical protein
MIKYCSVVRVIAHTQVSLMEKKNSKEISVKTKSIGICDDNWCVECIDLKILEANLYLLPSV